MRAVTTIILILLPLTLTLAQETDTVYLPVAISKNETILYKRIIEFNQATKLYHVRDYFDNGQIQMDGTYSKLDRNFKENYWCNYHTNIKQGLYQTWYKNGQPESCYHFIDGKKNGLCEEYYSNGQISTKGYAISGNKPGNTRGVKQGNFKGWSVDGKLLYDFDLENGMKVNPADTSYLYHLYKPKDYETDTTRTWPLIIYLHGGSVRGTDLKKLFNNGIPDQIYRGREFPFLIASPLCPLLIQWSTDNWFENFYKEITTRYRVDKNRVYLTGISLGGEGTWYLGVKYPEKFAAIAPIAGFTSDIGYIDENIDNLKDMPIWAFHGKIDNVVPFEETERIVNKLKGKNKNLRFTAEPEVGHGMDWIVYPGQELYDWFLQYGRKK
ncbi:MAG: prolyl oligopeptidase family serine peptidase [Bacteroidales bacterium]|nr:prolyl oligopeptidase family serine peptidase [Bacteroidales bacterium]